MSLITTPNFYKTGKRYFRDFSPNDDFYEMLIDTHRDLSDEQSNMVNAKLILLFGQPILGDSGRVGRGLGGRPRRFVIATAAGRSACGGRPQQGRQTYEAGISEARRS